MQKLENYKSQLKIKTKIQIKDICELKDSHKDGSHSEINL